MSSKDEIYDYVMNSPENTNGTVLGSLLSGLETGETEIPTIVGVADFEENTITFPEEITFKYLKNNLPQARIAFTDGEDSYFYLSLYDKEEFDYGENYIYSYKFDSAADLPIPSFILPLPASDDEDTIGTVDLYLLEDDSLIILEAGTVIRDGERFSFILHPESFVPTQQFIYENAERIAIYCSLTQGGGTPYVNLTLMERWAGSYWHEYVTFHGKTSHLDGEKDIYLVFDSQDTDETIVVPQIVKDARPKTMFFAVSDMELDEDGHITNEDVIAQLSTAQAGDIFYLFDDGKMYVPATFFDVDGILFCQNICINADSLQIAGISTMNQQDYDSNVWIFEFYTGEE